ncbi:MAG: hypothetical protein MJK12_15610 [Colwellia sp.]|nr:hypothetical protein [Colwellia sp.]
MKLIVCISLFLISASNCFASQTEHQAIKSIINTYQQSTEAKDKARFLTLFVDDSSPVIGVFSEETMKIRRAMVEKINKEDNKSFAVTRTFLTSPTQMMDNIVSEELSTKEKIVNIKIDSDDNIAHVYFDYVFYIDNKKKNWGSQSWQLVKTVTGWKISSITYSLFYPKVNKGS